MALSHERVVEEEHEQWRDGGKDEVQVGLEMQVGREIRAKAVGKAADGGGGRRVTPPPQDEEHHRGRGGEEREPQSDVERGNRPEGERDRREQDAEEGDCGVRREVDASGIVEVAREERVVTVE